MKHISTIQLEEGSLELIFERYSTIKINYSQMTQLWRHKFRDNVSRHEQDCIRRNIDVYFYDTCIIKIWKD